MKQSSKNSNRRIARRGERGAALVESAIVLQLLLLLVFGVIDGTMLMSAYLTAGDGATNGARAATEAADDPLADYDAMRAVLKSTSPLDAS